MVAELIVVDCLCLILKSGQFCEFPRSQFAITSYTKEVVESWNQMFAWATRIKGNSWSFVLCVHEKRGTKTCFRLKCAAKTNKFHRNFIQTTKKSKWIPQRSQTYRVEQRIYISKTKLNECFSFLFSKYFFKEMIIKILIKSDFPCSHHRVAEKLWKFLRRLVFLRWAFLVNPTFCRVFITE